jgi:hypothetical protein
MNKRMVVVSDFHAGHEYGLCPPCAHRRAASSKTGKFEDALWKFYARAIDSLKPIDILVVNGDCIEGKGESSGGVELLTPDRHDQAQIAADAIAYAEARTIRILYGTRRHVGKDEDFESVVVDKLKALKAKDAKIQGHAFFRVNGCGVDVKHKVTSSAIPHGRHTAIARARLWNAMWNAEHGRQPRADILIRSHVHYFGYAGGSSWLGVTTPALTFNSAYGIRECEGLVDVGLLAFDFEPNGQYSWWPILADFAELTVKAESL